MVPTGGSADRGRIDARYSDSLGVTATGVVSYDAFIINRSSYLKPFGKPASIIHICFDEKEDGLVNTRHILSPVVAVSLAASLSLGTLVPTVALADSDTLQAQVNEAQSRLNELYSEAEQRNYDLEATVGELNDTIKKLDKTTGEIKQTQADLVVARQHLGQVVADAYKAGEIDILQMLFESTDFDDLVSRVMYANKVATYHANAIAEVNELENSLKEKQATYTEEKERQEKLVEDQKALKEETDKAVDEAEAYYNQLSDELKAQIEIEQAAAALEAQKANEEAAARAAAQAEREATAAAQVSDTTEDNGGQTDAPAAQENDASDDTEVTTNDDTSDDVEDDNSGSGSVSTGYEAPASVTPSSTGSASAMVSQAYQAIGSAYRWSGYVWTGDPSTSAFTCSGLVDFALGRPTNSSWPTSLYAEVEGAGGIKTSIDQLNYGDLVFTGNGGIGHVGIYVGGGQFLDSSYDGVSVRAVNPGTFIGGGSIF